MREFLGRNEELLHEIEIGAYEEEGQRHEDVATLDSRFQQGEDALFVHHGFEGNCN